MANFESGVASYIHAHAVVEVFFPVDNKGNADICCAQCFYYREASKRCGLNFEVCEYPNKYVGSSCPLVRTDEEENNIEATYDFDKKENVKA